EGKVEHEHKGGAGATPLGGAVHGAALQTGTKSGGGTQDVHIKSSAATISTRQQGVGQTSIHGPAVVTGDGGGAVETEASSNAPKNVNVMTSPLRVAFSAITTMITVFAAPFGIGMGIGVGFMAAFAKGGEIPDDMIAKVHGGELMVDQTTHTA